MLARSIIVGFTCSVLALVPMRRADLPPQYLPMYGGNGGAAFTRGCGDHRVMTGVRYRSGLSLDGIGPICRTVNANGTLGTEYMPSMVGGTGGTLASARCGSTDVVFSQRIYSGTYVDGISFGCARWLEDQRKLGGFVKSLRIGRTVVNFGNDADCAGSTQPIVSLVGRASSLVDAIGAICDEP